MMDRDQHVQEIIDLHFDPRWGAPYWLALEPTLPFNPRADVRRIADLSHFPPFPAGVLANAPIERMIPRAFHDDLHAFVTSETGGATGAPKRTAYHPEDFEAAFVAPFVAAASLMGFPRKRHWLFVGPSGPHIIGKAARACAAALGSLDPFSVDFDPRWVRRLPPGSLGRTRYLDHVLEQALRITESQDIGVIFSTPPVLDALGNRMPEEARLRVTGIHLGGMAGSPEFWASLGGAWFPNAVLLSGYGNSLAGVCPQVTPCASGAPTYVPHGNRLVLDLVCGNSEDSGTIRFHRLDRAALMPCVLEGDEASAWREVPEVAVAAGFQPAGIRDPRPATHHAETREGGLY